jgi:hypothetical protein
MTRKITSGLSICHRILFEKEFFSRQKVPPTAPLDELSPVNSCKCTSKNDIVSPWRRARPEEKMSTVCSAIVSAAFVSDWMNDRRRVIWVALQIGSAFWLFLFLLALSHGGPPVAFFSFSPFFLFFSSYAFY